MQSPEQIAADFIERTRVPPGVRLQFEGELTAILTAYGAECAAQERERCATLIRNSEPELWATGSDQAFIAGYKAALSGIFAAIRALP